MNDGATRGKYYKEITVPAGQAEFSRVDMPDSPDADMGFRANSIILILDVGEAVEWSYNGTNVDGKIICEDRHLVFDDIDVSQIWFRHVSETDAKLRVWGWLKKQ